VFIVYKLTLADSNNNNNNNNDDDAAAAGISVRSPVTDLCSMSTSSHWYSV